MVGRQLHLMTLALAVAAALTLGACAGAMPAGLTAADVAAGSEAAVADPLIEIRGTLESMDLDTMTVAGKVVAIIPETELRGTFLAGDLVKVHAAITAAGDLVAREIEPLSAESEAKSDGSGHFEFTGLVESIGTESWTVDGKALAMTSETEIDDAIMVGDRVKVEAQVAIDGALTATEIKLAGSEDHSEESESASVEFIGLVESLALESWTVDGKTLAITPETEIEDLIKVGDLVKVEAISGADSALVAKEIQLAGAEDQHEDGPSGDVEFSGFVESISADLWTVGGKTLVITSETEIAGTIKVGDSVKVEAKLGTGGALVADEIKLASESSSGDAKGTDDHGDSSTESGGKGDKHGSAYEED